MVGEPDLSDPPSGDSPEPSPWELVAPTGFASAVPDLVAATGAHASKRFLEFFAATIRNRNTRAAYATACAKFLGWCQDRGCRDLADIQPVVVAAYIETHPGSVPTVKQHLAAVKRLFDWLVTGQVVPTNPAHAVRGPTHIVSRGKTLVLDAAQARLLLDSIPIVRPDGSPDLVGLRDRALVGVMVFSFARVSAVVGMKMADYYQQGKRWWIRLREKGGKLHQVPLHHKAEAYLDAYLDALAVEAPPRSPLFRSATLRGALAETGMDRTDVLRMVKRRARRAGLPADTCCHTFRGTGITAYLENGGNLENAQAIAAHSSPRTTKLYDRRNDEIALEEVERIRI